MHEKKQVLEEFDSLVKNYLHEGLLTKIDEDIYFKGSKSNKTIGLIASTHGDEPIGLKIFSNLLKSIQDKSFLAEHSFYLIFANRKAYEKNTRFIEEDLNRSYHLTSSSHEGKRAKEITKILDKCDLCIDIHQTVHETSTPFWIIAEGYEKSPFLSPLKKLIPGVVAPHAESISTARSYMTSKRKLGLTLEISDFGFDKEAVALGEKVLEETLSFNFSSKEKPTLDLYQIHFHAPFPGGKKVKWKDGLKNFDFVKREEVLGTIDGKEFSSQKEGLILLYPAHFFLWKNPPKGLYILCGRSDGKNL